MHWVYYFGRGLIRVLIFPFAAWKVRGKENIPSCGPSLIICNHLHLADPPIVAASIPLKCIFMAKVELWNNSWSRFWVENFGALPVSRGAADIKTIRHAEDWLQKGVSLIIFPEGGRSKSGKLQTALHGAALIVERSGVPVLPVSISGTEKLRNMRPRSLLWCLFHRPRITVSIGRPFHPTATDDKLTRTRRHKLMNEIMLKIAVLLPREYRGVYGDEKNGPD